MKTVIPLVLLLFLLAGCDTPEKPTVTLYLAMQRGDIEQIERHIVWGTDMNQLDRDGYAPLHVAVRNGRVAIVRLLLKKGVDVQRRDAQGHDALYHAVLGAHLRIADLLLKAGADLDATALLLAAVDQDVSEREVYRYLNKHGADMNLRDKDGDTPLLKAIHKGNHKLAKHLVSFGADVTVTDKNGKTALAIAKSLGLRDIAQLLQRNGAT
ncbi:ankyrin repeat domain-containing protein [Thiolapillus sp.]